MSRTIVIVLVFLFLGACASPRGEDAGTPASPPTASAQESVIVVGLVQAPTSLDPADHRNRASETVIRNMFDGLVTRDTRSDVHLELAEAMQWLDESTLEIKLRRGVHFHDGVEMTAEDVVYTFNRIITDDAIEYPEPHTSPRKSLIAPLIAIEQVDSYTVVMHFNGPWPPAMQMLVHQQIVPKHYLEEVGTEGFIDHPIGTGPFRFVSASADLKEVVLERFDNYYGGAPSLQPVGVACVDRVIFRVISDNLTRVAALRIGEVDIIQAVPLDLVEDLSGRSDIQVKTAPGTRPVWMELNVNHALFEDVAVRQALNYAIDKQRIIDEVYDGKAVALPGPLSPFNNFVSEELAPYPYDLDMASSLLARSLWANMIIDYDTEGGVYSSSIAIGQATSRFTLDTLPEWRPLAEAIAQQFHEIGIEVVVRLWEREDIVPRLLAGERASCLTGWGDSAFDPVGHFEAKWHGYTEDLPYGRGNYSGYNNERVNKLIRLAESTADPIVRQEIYDEAQRIIYEEAPAIFLILPEQIEAASSLLQNWEPSSDGRINLHDVCVVP